jgi:hypothetical protein
MQALDDVIEHGTKAALTQMVDRAAAKSLPALDELRTRRDEVRLLDEVRLAGGRPAKPQTQAAAAASKAFVADLAHIPAFGLRMKSDTKDAQGARGCRARRRWMRCRAARRARSGIPGKNPLSVVD